MTNDKKRQGRSLERCCIYIYDDDVEVVARAKQYKLSRPVFAHSAVLFVFIVFNRLLICVR